MNTLHEEVKCWLCGSNLVAKEVLTLNNEVKVFITCDSCFTDLIVIDKNW